MTDEQFEQLPKAQLLIGAKHCLTNATMHFDSAKSIAKLGHYPIANSLLILAAEEAVKGYVLTAAFFSVPLPFKISPIFRNHTSKHVQAEDMEAMVVVSYAMSKAFADPKKNFMNQLVQAIISAATVGMSLDSIRSERTKWWKDANNMKNRSLYVDFRNGAWLTEHRISEEEYRKTVGIVEPFLEGVKYIMGLKESDYKKIYKK
jgi:AbiV family abortive infection protein